MIRPLDSILREPALFQPLAVTGMFLDTQKAKSYVRRCNYLFLTPETKLSELANSQSEKPIS